MVNHFFVFGTGFYSLLAFPFDSFLGVCERLFFLFYIFAI